MNVQENIQAVKVKKTYLWDLKYLAQEVTKVAKYHKGQINGAGISAGAANICVNVRARTTPVRVCSAPPRSAALGWSLPKPNLNLT